MSLLKDFYSINQIENCGDGLHKVSIVLNAGHDIFKGHFPGNPVTPGVCMMQITKELAEEIIAKKLFLTSASNVKFMAIINPVETPELLLELKIEEHQEDVKLKNTTSFGETIALKMTINYKIVS